MTRRERAQRTLLSDLDSLSMAERVVMFRTLDAYEAELAKDLENEETVERAYLAFCVQDERQFAHSKDAMRAALWAALEG